MCLGLASRSDRLVLPEIISLYAGDTLWASLVFWLVRMIKPSLSMFRSAVIALCFAFTIELLQFYHAPWIDSIRATTLGGLVLGFGFQFSDLVCYSFGVLIGYTLGILSGYAMRARVIPDT